MRRNVLALIGLTIAAPSLAGTYPGSREVILDTSAVNAEGSFTRPGYGVWKPDNTHNSRVLRITEDNGNVTSFSGPGGGAVLWGNAATHHYSKDQPWSSDGRWYVTEMDGGSPGSEIILDTHNTYRPYRRLDCSGKPSFYEQRWWPRDGFPNQMVGVYDISGHPVVELRDVINCVSISTLQLSDSLGCIGCSGGGIGWSEGNLSFNGRFLAVGKFDSSASAPSWRRDMLAVQVVDFDSSRVGPVNLIGDTICSRRSNDRSSVTNYKLCVEATGFVTGIGAARVADSTITHWSVSPSGAFLVLKYRGSAGAPEPPRVFDLDTLGLNFGHVKPHAYTLSATGAAINGSSGGIYRRGAIASGDTLLGAQGWISSNKHEDMTMDPDSSVDILVGIYRAAAQNRIEIIRTNLSSGFVSPVMLAQGYEPLHVSTRNWHRLGWAYVSGGQPVGGDTTGAYLPYWDEFFALKLDGTAAVQRFGKFHVNRQRDDASEPVGVPNWDGTYAAHISNWRVNCDTLCGPAISQLNDYVYRIGCLPPRAISDLNTTFGTDQTNTTITLRWSKPGEDTLLYDPPIPCPVVRFSRSAVSGVTFDADSSFLCSGDLGVPGLYGQTHTITVTGLTPDTDYFFAVKYASDCGLKSDISNVICVTTKANNGSQRTCSAPSSKRKPRGGRTVEIAE